MAPMKVLHDVSFDIHAGAPSRWWASGSGKSTAARVITGLLPPKSGEVLFEGNALPPITASAPREELRRSR
jgi:peptide/nickel transport system ATP-binding protein